MVVSSRAATVGQKELKTKWPVEEGITAGTTKQLKTSPILLPKGTFKVKTVVRKVDSVGIR